MDLSKGGDVATKRKKNLKIRKIKLQLQEEKDKRKSTESPSWKYLARESDKKL